jgi:quinol monooxygenase YgiN
MIIGTLRMTVRPEERDGFLKAIRCMLEPARVEPGCMSFNFYQDIKDENTFILVEEWETNADFDNHIRKDGYKKLLLLMDLLSEKPDIKINTVSQRGGLEYVENVLFKYI